MNRSIDLSTMWMKNVIRNMDGMKGEDDHGDKNGVVRHSGEH